jgi:hypothetical protein
VRDVDEKWRGRIDGGDDPLLCSGGVHRGEVRT